MKNLLEKIVKYIENTIIHIFSTKKQEMIEEDIGEEKPKELKITEVEDSMKEEISEEALKLEFGTVILANRYQNEEEMLEIEEGHRVGPYVVVNQNSDGFICIYGSGNASKKGIYTYQHKISKEDIDVSLTKDTYFIISQIKNLEEKRIIKKLGTISNIDKNLMAKKITLAHFRKVYQSFEESNSFQIPAFTFDVGDIVRRYGKDFFLYEKNEDGFEGFRVTMVKDSIDIEGKIISINSVRFLLDFDTIQTIKVEEKLGLTDTVSKEQTLSILEMMKKHYQELEKKKEYKRGGIIEYQKMPFYIYGEEGAEWLLFKLSKEKAKTMIVIQKEEFHPEFNEEARILKKEQERYPLLFNATDEEIDEMKSMKKTYKKTNIVKKSKKTTKARLNIPSVKEGSIIEERTLSRDKYIVLKRNGNQITRISLEDVYKEDAKIEQLEVANIFSVGTFPKEEFEKLIEWVYPKVEESPKQKRI